ncbi:MAG: sigma-70 family RNA polymerase sigma factor [Caldilineaceae bacterium]|nr:sigma-70 family RNA polymerase sigma factor [Caldilineaceae bacterium]MCB9151673.1 sigma-70 family RNA polymerase sigma factor [Caldilineaceae bacterium]
MYANSQQKSKAHHDAAVVSARGERSNQQWLVELTGQRGTTMQAQAHLDLALHLQKKALTYLYVRQSGVPLLNALTREELSQFAQDFAQEAMEKLARDEHALLAKYDQRGKFLSWMTQVLRHMIASELRLSAWKTRHSQPCDDVLAHLPAALPNPERAAMIGHIGDILCAALTQLPGRYRIAFWERVAEGRSAAEVGEMLGISANAVNVLVYRAKMKLREYLAGAGVTAEVLVLFS